MTRESRRWWSVLWLASLLVAVACRDGSSTPPLVIATVTTTSGAVPTATTAAPTTTAVPMSAGTWRDYPGIPLASAGSRLAAAWTDRGLFVWVGGGPQDAALLDLATGTWRATVSSGLAARDAAIAVSTGSEVIVWGGKTVGHRGEGPAGAIYDASRDVWRVLPPAPIGLRNADAAVVWTGREMLVWSGTEEGVTARPSGAAYDPQAYAWRTLPDAPIDPRSEAAVVWTGRELLVWGGLGVPGDGAAYDPSANTWRVLAKAPLGSRIANAVWTGTEMVIRAGRSGNGNGVFAYSNAAAYNPATDTWRQLADGPAHPGFQAVWTGQGLLMFAKGSGVRFTSETGWQDLPHAGFTVPTEGTVVWTGREAVLAGVVSSRIAVVSYTP